MTIDEKVDAFDAIVEAFTNRWHDGTWTWWNPNPASGSATPRKSRPEAVADLIAFAKQAQARNRKKWTELAIAAVKGESPPCSS
jgi:hypothetical protein